MEPMAVPGFHSMVVSSKPTSGHILHSLTCCHQSTRFQPPPRSVHQRFEHGLQEGAVLGGGAQAVGNRRHLGCGGGRVGGVQPAEVAAAGDELEAHPRAGAHPRRPRGSGRVRALPQQG